MMFQTNVGAMTDASSVAYLRPETAQGMFADFRSVVDTGRVKLPFGIAQIGKSFRNEITPRNFIFRSREFEQMEMEYFIHEDADWAKCHREWINWCKDWLLSIGLPESHLSEYNHPKEKLAFYSRGTTDIMFRYPFGVQELWGIAARGDYDLKQHEKHSGVPQVIFDEASKKKFSPHVIEPAVGVDRIFLALLCAGYAEEEVKDDKGNVEKRTVLRLSPRIAPVKVAVFPLMKNKPEIVAVAEALHKKLQRRYAAFYDETGAIGRRYRRQDEIGTPWCVTIDFDTIEKDGLLHPARARFHAAEADRRGGTLRPLGREGVLRVPAMVTDRRMLLRRRGARPPGLLADFGVEAPICPTHARGIVPSRRSAACACRSPRRMRRPRREILDSQVQ